MPRDSDLTDNRLLKISVPISADVLKEYFQLLILSSSLWWHCTWWVESSGEIALLKAAGYCGPHPANGALGQKQEPMQSSDTLRSADPCSPWTCHCTLPCFSDSHDSSLQMALIRTAVAVAWLGRFGLTLFEAIIISPGSCSIGVLEIKALHDFSNWQVVMVMGWEGYSCSEKWISKDIITRWICGLLNSSSAYVEFLNRVTQ